MRSSEPLHTPKTRQRADARLRILTRSAILAATGATVAIGVVVAKEHPGATATSGTSATTTPTTSGSSGSTASTSSSTSSAGTAQSNAATTTTTAPTATTYTPVVTSGGSSSGR